MLHSDALINTSEHNPAGSCCSAGFCVIADEAYIKQTHTHTCSSLFIHAVENSDEDVETGV